MKLYAVVTTCDQACDEWWYGIFEHKNNAIEKCKKEISCNNDKHYQTEVRVYSVTEEEDLNLTEMITTDDTKKEFLMSRFSYDIAYPPEKV